jgi:hypothetical protein
MKRSLFALSLAALASVTALPSCIIHVDADGGMDSGFYWDDDHNGSVRRGSGVSATEARSTADFHAIDLRCAADVRATIGTERKLDVTSDDNLLRYVRTEVRDGRLVIELEPGRYSFHRGVSLEIVVPALDALALSGSGNVELIDLAGQRMSIAVSGSGDVSASGHVDTLDASVSGSGDLDLSKLEAKSARAQITGSGDIQLAVSEHLDATIAGSGDIRFTGSATVNSQVTGSGSVARR